MKSLKESRVGTMILEKEEKPSEDFVVETKEEVKKESAKKVLFENNSTETYMENLKKNFSKPEKKVERKPVSPKIQFEATETFFAKPKAQEDIKKEPATEIKQEIEIQTENKKQEYIQEDVSNEIQEETPKEEKRLKRAKFKTRLGIMIFGLVSVLACMIGWTISNAVEIKTLTQELEQANKIYSVNVVKHISNISKADDLIDENSITNIDKLGEAQVIKLTPEKLKKPVEYSVKSNWFDRLCNWLSNLFN